MINLSINPETGKDLAASIETTLKTEREVLKIYEEQLGLALRYLNGAESDSARRTGEENIAKARAEIGAANERIERLERFHKRLTEAIAKLLKRQDTKPESPNLATKEHKENKDITGDSRENGADNPDTQQRIPAETGDHRPPLQETDKDNKPPKLELGPGAVARELKKKGKEHAATSYRYRPMPATVVSKSTLDPRKKIVAFDSREAVKILAGLLEPFTNLDVSARIDADQAAHWIQTWLHIKWIYEPCFGQFRRTVKFYQKNGLSEPNTNPTSPKATQDNSANSGIKSGSALLNQIHAEIEEKQLKVDG